MTDTINPRNKVFVKRMKAVNQPLGDEVNRTTMRKTAFGWEHASDTNRKSRRDEAKFARSKEGKAKLKAFIAEKKSKKPFTFTPGYQSVPMKREAWLILFLRWLLTPIREWNSGRIRKSRFA